MQPRPTSTEPEDDLFDSEAATTECHLVILDELLAIGMNLARSIETHATADNIGVTALAYERIARAVRRSIMLAHRLENAPCAAARHTARQAAEAKARIRAEQPANTATAPPKVPAEPGQVRATRDRLESIGNEPAHIIILGLCRDIARAAKTIVQPLRTKPPHERRQTEKSTIRPHQRPTTRPQPTLNSQPPRKAPARGSG